MEYVERYLLARDISQEYADCVRAFNQKFEKWRGGTVYVAELEPLVVNRWLSELQAIGHLSASSISSYRAAVLCVWREAYFNGDCKRPPLQVRNIKKRHLVVQAYTHDEIKQLLKAAAALNTYYPNGVLASDFWQVAIYAAYATGLRRADLLAVNREQLREDGTAVVVQQKTGYPICVRFCDKALKLIRKFPAGGRVLPWPYHMSCFTRTFVRLRKAAGVTRGSFKWLRRSAGSYSESMRHGDGSKILGHRCESVFRSHYEDTGITSIKAVQPPVIQDVVEKGGAK